jgi:regulator of protease activity HflC (stomatin/prohibitin superfamily)
MIALVGLTELEIEIAAIALIVIVGVIAVAVAGIKIVGQYERGLIESWGAYSKTVGPGLKFIMP